jgi:hypothetical protein
MGRRSPPDGCVPGHAKVGSTEVARATDPRNYSLARVSEKLRTLRTASHMHWMPCLAPYSLLALPAADETDEEFARYIHVSAVKRASVASQALREGGTGRTAALKEPGQVRNRKAARATGGREAFLLSSPDDRGARLPSRAAKN